MDNVILSHDVGHSLKRKKKESMVIQLDLSKVYDNIKWDYMKLLLGAFGFDK